MDAITAIYKGTDRNKEVDDCVLLLTEKAIALLSDPNKPEQPLLDRNSALAVVRALARTCHGYNSVNMKRAADHI